METKTEVLKNAIEALADKAKNATAAPEAQQFALERKSVQRDCCGPSRWPARLLSSGREQHAYSALSWSDSSMGMTKPAFTRSITTMVLKLLISQFS